MRNYKQLIAGAMAAIMVLGSSVVALAQEGGTTGQGELDIVEQSDIFKVELPVIPEGYTPFNYILDPTGVISDTGAAKYGGASFESGETLFFKNTDGSYKHTSDTLTVTNKSTVDVTVTVDFTVAEVAGIKMNEDDNFVSGGDAQIYLGFVDTADYASPASPGGITYEGFTATADINKAATGSYVVKYVTDGDGSGHYVKELDDGNASFSSYSFSLEGACSTDGWNDLATVTPPSIEVVWTVEDPVSSGPSTDKTEYTIDPSDSVYVKINYGTATKITKVEHFKGSTNTWETLDSTNYVLEDLNEDGKDDLRFRNTYVKSLTVDKKVRITFDNGETVEITLKCK